MNPLNLKFKVYKVEKNQNTGMVEVYADVDAPITDEEKIKNPIAEPLYRSDKQIESEFEEKAIKIGQAMMQHIQFPPGMSFMQPKKPPIAVVVFVVTEAHFNAMGRPTIGDYLPVSVCTQKIEPADDDCREAKENP